MARDRSSLTLPAASVSYHPSTHSTLTDTLGRGLISGSHLSGNMPLALQSFTTKGTYCLVTSGHQQEISIHLLLVFTLLDI
ncbi:unnamed protein product [Haemonchus placei]|uniref:Uncharacterized protein n=1 Tax=Haemonchus placei TaxID=6290 RepID=A0A0N4W9G4_HAEPC|nr:unnamed protein product [Haemonchus placei]